MQTRRDTVGRVGEAVLELVAVGVRLVSRDDRGDRLLGDAGDPHQRVAHLTLLQLCLYGVRQGLQPTTPARRKVRAWRDDPIRARLEDVERGGLGMPALHAVDSGADPITGKDPGDEDDEAVDAGDPARAIGQRLDGELELVPGHGEAWHAPIVRAE